LPFGGCTLEKDHSGRLLPVFFSEIRPTVLGNKQKYDNLNVLNKLVTSFTSHKSEKHPVADQRIPFRLRMPDRSVGIDHIRKYFEGQP